MKELFRTSILFEGPSLGQLSKIKLPKVLTTELVTLTKKASELIQVIMDEEISKNTAPVACKNEEAQHE